MSCHQLTNKFAEIFNVLDESSKSDYFKREEVLAVQNRFSKRPAEDYDELQLCLLDYEESLVNALLGLLYLYALE